VPGSDVHHHTVHIRALTERLGSLGPRLGQWCRYAAVSVVSTLTSLTTLGLLVGVVGFEALWANLVATAVGTVPSFELNRRFVWRRRGPASLRRQVVPFTALSFAGLALSSLTIRVASGLSAHAGRAGHTAAVEVASVAAFGSLWLVQFVLLDRVLFVERGSRSETGGAVPDDVVLGQLGQLGRREPEVAPQHLVVVLPEHRRRGVVPVGRATGQAERQARVALASGYRVVEDLEEVPGQQLGVVTQAAGEDGRLGRHAAAAQLLDGRGDVALGQDRAEARVELVERPLLLVVQGRAEGAGPVG